MKYYFYLAFLLPLTCSTGEIAYQCVVKDEAFLREDGSMKPYPKNLNKGNRFAIDRLRGTVVGHPISNTTASEVRILSKGSDRRSFELLSVSSPTGKATTDLLVIQENVKSTKKPFVAIDSSGSVYSGTCD